MNLVKKNIHMNKLKGKSVTQITLDEDFNIPDSKADVSRIVLKQGEVILEPVKALEEKVNINGQLQFEVLYSTQTDNATLESYSGNIPFNEMINFPELEPQDRLQVKWDMEDMSVSMINSRKIRANAIVTFEICAEQLYDEEAAEEVEDEGVSLEKRRKSLEIMQIRLQKKDTYRIKEEVEINGNKPNIEKLLWTQLSLRSVECKPLDGKMSVRGDLLLFALYSAEEEHIPVQWLERSIAFSGEVECNECSSNFICDTSVSILHKEIEAKPDYDGENRIIAVDVILELNMKLYEEERIQLLNDVYTPTKEIVPEIGNAFFENLLVKNIAKCKIVDKMKLKGEEKILQVCHSEGNVKIDHMNVVDDGVAIEGAVEVELLFMSSDDKEPLKSVKGSVPFTYTVEVKDINENSVFNITPSIEQLSTVVLGNDEIEVRCIITLDTLALQKIKEDIIIDVKEYPLDESKIEAMPGIIGYIVKPEDCLWSIAKNFYTTIDCIKTTNNITSDTIKPGERLLLIKQAEEL